MAKETIVVEVPDARVMETRVEEYAANGFHVVNYAGNGVSLFKKGKFNFFWAILGYFTATPAEQEKDTFVEIRIVGRDER